MCLCVCQPLRVACYFPYLSTLIQDMLLTLMYLCVFRATVHKGQATAVVIVMQGLSLGLVTEHVHGVMTNYDGNG